MQNLLSHAFVPLSEVEREFISKQYITETLQNKLREARAITKPRDLQGSEIFQDLIFDLADSLDLDLE